MIDYAERLKRAEQVGAEIDALLGIGDPKVDLGSFSRGHDLRQLENIKTLMGKNFIGPEDYKDLLRAKDVGVIPPLPLAITEELLESPCPFLKDKKIKETHLLVFVPNTINREDFTINSLRQLVADSEDKHRRERIFDDQSWYNDQEFAATPIVDGKWVLLPMSDLPNSRNKTNAERLEELKKYPDYQTAGALELTTALVMHELKNHQRKFADFYGWCEELTNEGRLAATGLRVDVGGFGGSGLYVGHCGDERSSNIGRAVVRRSWK